MSGIVTIGIAQPIENNSFTVHIEDAHFLVIGFEVNKSPLTNPNFAEDMERERRKVEEKAKEIEEMNKGRKQRGEKLEGVPQFKMPENVYSRYSITDDYESNTHVDMGNHNALEDPGHTFMYLVKNKNATIFLSLGPLINDNARLEEYRKENGYPSQQEIDEMMANNKMAQVGYDLGHTVQRAYGRGTADYHILEKTFLFKMFITEKQYDAIYERVVRIKTDIASGTSHYNIFNNHTCAKVVRYDAIGDVAPNLPWGRSQEVVSSVQLVNPYALYEQIKEYASQAKRIREFVIDKGDEETTRDFWNKFIEAIRSGKNPRDILLPAEDK